MKRDEELTSLLGVQNTREKVKGADRDKTQKSKWLNETILMKLKDSEGVVRPGCEYKVQRRKMSEKTVQDLINRGPLKVELDYFYDSSGSTIWVEDMLLNAQSPPEYYFIVPKVRKISYDICQDPHYEGQRCFAIAR